MLALSREVAALERLDPAERLHAALLLVTRDRALAAPEGRTAKMRVLALAWAREQLRVALEELVQHAAARGIARADLPADALAWLLLAGADALVFETAESAADRVQWLERLLAPPPRPRRTSLSLPLD
jgi:hypothetical protein